MDDPRVARFRQMERDGLLGEWARNRCQTATFEEMIPLLAAVFAGDHRTSGLPFSDGSRRSRRRVFCDRCRTLRIFLHPDWGWWCRTCRSCVQ